MVSLQTSSFYLILIHEKLVKMEDDRIILLNNAGEPVGEEDDLNLTDPTGPFLRSINTTKTRMSIMTS